MTIKYTKESRLRKPSEIGFKDVGVLFYDTNFIVLTSILVLQPCMDTTTPLCPSNSNDSICFSLIGWSKNRFDRLPNWMQNSRENVLNWQMITNNSLLHLFLQKNTNIRVRTNSAICISIFPKQLLHLTYTPNNFYYIRICNYHILTDSQAKSSNKLLDERPI